MANLRTVINMLCENTALEKKQTELREEVEEAAALAEQCVSENARIVLDQNEYAERYERLVQRYEKAKSELDAVMQELPEKEMRKKQMEDFLRMLAAQEPIARFETELWASLVDFMTVYSKTDIRVTFKDGTEI